MKIKKMFASGLAATMMFAMFQIPVSASAVPETTKEEILQNYLEEMMQLKSNNISVASTESLNLKDETIAKLNAAGYEAYSVSPDTYEEVEAILNTDFSDINLDPNCSYIITLGNEETRGKNSSAYSYAKSGTSYTMRTVTVTADDDYRYYQTNDKDLMETYADSLIRNVINTGISAYADYVTGPLHFGTILSVIGFDVTDFVTNNNNSIRVDGSVAWTRYFTQVLSPYDNQWYYGSSTETAYTLVSYSGHRYNPNTNRPETIPAHETSDTLESPHYDYGNWDEENAVIGFLGGYTVYDTTGDITLRYEENVGSAVAGDEIFTLRENF